MKTVRDKRVTVRLNAQEHELLKLQSKREDKKVSRLLRDALINNSKNIKVETDENKDIKVLT